MNKFLRGALACAAVIPCLTGLVGCGEKKYSSETAYNQISEQVGGMLTDMSTKVTQGGGFQLNISLSVHYDIESSAAIGMNTNFGAEIRAAIGVLNGENKQLFANLGLVNEGNVVNLLSAYASDDIDKVDGDSDEGYVTVTPTAETWQYYAGMVYVQNESEEYVLAGDTFDVAATYFMKTQDYVHIYLSSNVDEFADETGFDINEVFAEMGVPFELPDGKIYATLNAGDLIPEIPAEPDLDVDEPEDDMGLDYILNSIANMDYDTLMAAIGEDPGMKVLANKTSAGDVELTISGYGTALTITAKAAGGLRLAITSDQEYDDVKQTVSIVLDIDLSDEVDLNNIPTDFEGYNEEPQDFETMIEEFVAGLEEMV